MGVAVAAGDEDLVALDDGHGAVGSLLGFPFFIEVPEGFSGFGVKGDQVFFGEAEKLFGAADFGHDGGSVAAAFGFGFPDDFAGVFIDADGGVATGAGLEVHHVAVDEGDGGDAVFFGGAAGFGKDGE